MAPAEANWSRLRRRLRACEERPVQPIQRAVFRCELPPEALLRTYVADGAYTDCYATNVAASVRFADFVEAFYTTAPFKAERLALGLLVAKPSNDAQARRLACGDADAFAAWRVEARAPDQLLVCDFLARTRSWLMIAPHEAGGARLYFGSAVVPAGRGRLGFPFNALLGFHQLYSRVLLGAARARVLGLAAARGEAASVSLPVRD